MSTDAAPDPSPAPTTATTDDHLQPDHVLAALVDIINDLDFELGVTLYTAGGIVSGLVISGRSYFERLGETIGGHGKIGDALGKQFANLSESYRSRQPTDDELDQPTDPDADQAKVRRVAYIHMREVTVHAPGAVGVLEQGLWRGRLAAVGGWSLGNWLPKAPPQ